MIVCLNPRQPWDKTLEVLCCEVEMLTGKGGLIGKEKKIIRRLDITYHNVHSILKY
jgi:hypothetical protein